MKPLFLLPGQSIKILANASLVETLKELSAIPEGALDEPQKFMTIIQHVEKGSTLKVSQLYIKGNDEKNYITFVIEGGLIATNYNKYIVKNNIVLHKIRIQELKEKLKTIDSKDKYKQDLQYELKNREKALDKLTKKDKKTGFTKLLKVNLKDVESWDVSFT
jgi:hypothetical protein